MERQDTHRGLLLSPEEKLNMNLPKLSDLIKFKGCKILSLNTRSLLPKINLLRTDLVNIRFDVLAICESWLKPWVN